MQRRSSLGRILSAVFLAGFTTALTVAASGPAAGQADAGPDASGEPADLLIRGGRVVDGTGGPSYAADVAVREGRISAVGHLTGTVAVDTVDAEGRVVAPGFIDMMGQASHPLAFHPPSAESKLRQGITTMLSGEGWSPAPQNDRTAREFGEGLERSDGQSVSWRTYSEYLRLLEAEGVALNVVHSVGAAQVRRIVVGEEDVDPADEQMARMVELVEEAMRDGAVGLSTALIYPPGSYATTDELIELARAAGRHGGRYFTHMRNESHRLVEAVEEAIRIGREAGVPVHIFHLKAAGRENWPLMAEALDAIRAARADGHRVTADIYPYVRNGIGLGSFLHPRHYSEGRERFLESLSDPAVRRRLRQEVETTSDWENWYRHVGGDWSKVLIAGVGSEEDADLVGLSLSEAAEHRGTETWKLFFDLVQRGGVSVNPRSMNEEQKRLALRAPFVAFDTDASPLDPARVDAAHPRAFGAFPRVLARYVREQGILSLEEAVRRLTSLPAGILGLEDRGTLRPGARADLVVFDPATVRDRATFREPLLYAEGIDDVFVNGTAVVRRGRVTGQRPGTLVRHGAEQRVSRGGSD